MNQTPQTSPHESKKPINLNDPQTNLPPDSTTNTSTYTDPLSISIVESEDHLSSISDAELSPAEQITFQMDLMKLLERRVHLFTSNESSSIPEFTAHELLLSILFTLDIDADEPDARIVRAIMEEGIEKQFAYRLDEIAQQITYGNQLLKQANQCTPFLGSRALSDTLRSIQKASSEYDYRFFAHVIPAEIDYPLALPVPEALKGITYLNEYLNRLIIEGTFLQHFNLDTSKRLLKTIHIDYQELLVNLFEPIATNAIGCTIAEKEPFSLSVNADDISLITSKLEHVGKKASMVILKQAADHLSAVLKITDSPTRLYIEKTTLNLYPRIKNALKHESLEGVFLFLS